MKKPVRTFLNLVLVLVFLFSITMFLQQQREKSIAGDAYAAALALATSEKSAARQEGITPATETTVPAGEPQWVVAPPDGEDPYIQALTDMDLETLRQTNPDVVGWILIPETAVNYPLMQGTDNDYYLKRTWDRKRNDAGSIFLEYLCDPELTGFNTIVYGHNMMDGSMFASLRKYREQTYWEEHPYVYLRSDQGVYRYEIFSSYLASVDSSTYGLDFAGEASRSQFLEQIRMASVIETGVEPEPTDRVLTLSTCSGKGYSTRWVVHARLKMIPAQPQ